MQEKIVYEYATIRFVPKVERGEFVNVGIILFSKSAKYIRFDYLLNQKKLAAFGKDLDIEPIETTLQSYQKIANGEQEGGEIAALDIPERFRWLTAVRSACIQTSPTHTGLTHDADHEFCRLWNELVL